MKKFYKLALALTMMLSAVPAFEIFFNQADARSSFDVELEDYVETIVLPSNYTRYKYLSFNDDENIMDSFNTGVINGEGSYSFEIKSSLNSNSLTSSYPYLFGNYIDNNHNVTGLRLHTGLKRVYFCYDNKATAEAGFFAFSNDEAFTVLLTPQYPSVNNARKAYTANKDFKGITNTGEYKIGGLSMPLSSKIYSFKIWDESSLVRFYVPCSNPNGILGFYDLINDNFIQSNIDVSISKISGEILGSTHDHEVSKDVLPSYIDPAITCNVCNAKFDTGVSGATSGLSFDITFKVSKINYTSGTQPQIFSNYVDGITNCYRMCINGSAGYMLFSYDTIGNNPTDAGNRIYLSQGEKINVKMDPQNGILLNGETKMSQNDFNVFYNSKHLSSANSSNIQIYATNSDVCTYYLYRFKIYQNNNLLRDYVPVFNNKTNNGGFYDLVNESMAFENGNCIAEKCDFCLSHTCMYSFSKDANTTIYSDNGLLCFPSDVNFNAVTGLSFEQGTILKTYDSPKTITVTNAPIDFTLLFGSMNPGVCYPLIVVKDGAETYARIIKSSNLSSLFLQLNDDISKINGLNVYKKDTLYLNGSLNKYSASGVNTHSLTISKLKARGNVSWISATEKKPYNINLSTKSDLIGCGCSSKKWALINHSSDGDDTQVGNSASWIGAQFGYYSNLFGSLNPSYNMDYEYIDLYINGDYRGNYILMERISADRFDIAKNKYSVEDEIETTRIYQSEGIGLDTTGNGVADKKAFSNCTSSGYGSATDYPLVKSTKEIGDATNYITLTAEEDSNDLAISSGIQAYEYATSSTVDENGYGGFILEFARPFFTDMYGEHSWFITRRGQCFTLKSPEFASQEQVQKIASYVQEFEDALFSNVGINSKGKHYAQYLDINSFAKQYAIQNFMTNPDFLDASTFLYADVNPSNGEMIGKLKGDISWDMHTAEKFAPSVKLITKPSNTFREAFYNEQFLTKGDFVNELYELTKEGSSFKAALDNAESEYGDLIDSIESSSLMSCTRFSNDLFKSYDEYKNQLIDFVASRRTEWYGSIFNASDNLLGITLKNDAGTLKANVTNNSNHGDFTWYKVEDDGTYTQTYTGSANTYVPSVNGSYVVAATGGNMAYTTIYGNASPLLNSATITMSSNPINYRIAKYSSTYDSLDDALADTDSGDLLIVDKNYSDSTNYYVKEGATVDLFGSCVTNVNAFISSGNIIDTNPTKGILNASTILFDENQEYLPIYDSSNNGYSFYNVTIEDQISSNNKLQFRMTKSSSECNAALDLIGQNIVGSRIKAQVSVSYKQDDGTGKFIDVVETFSYDSAWMQYIIFGSGDPIKTYKRVLNFTIQNMSSLSIAGDIYMQCSFVSYNGSTAIASVKGTKWKTSDLGTTWVAA